MTLLPEAVLVDTMTCRHRARLLIADTWWTYNAVILRESRRAPDIVSDKAGYKSAGGVRVSVAMHIRNASTRTKLSLSRFEDASVLYLFLIPLLFLDVVDDLLN